MDANNSKILKQLKEDPANKNYYKNKLPSLFIFSVAFNGFYYGYFLNLMDEIGVFVVLLKKNPIMAGFGFFNWFISQIFSSAIITVLKINILPDTTKLKKSYKTGLIMIFFAEMFLLPFSLILANLSLKTRLSVLSSTSMYLYILYLLVKFIQNTIEFSHGIITTRVCELIIMTLSERNSQGELESDHEVIMDNNLKLLSKKELIYIIFKFLGNLLCLIFRPGYFYYLLSRDRVYLHIAKRTFVIFCINGVSYYLLSAVDLSKLKSSGKKTYNQQYLKSLKGAIKIIISSFFDIFKKIPLIDQNMVRIKKVRVIVYLILYFGHAFFAALILDILKYTLILGGINGVEEDMYYKMAFSSVIQMISVILVVLLSQKLESIWAKKYSREKYHILATKFYMICVFILGICAFFKLIPVYNIILLYNIINFSTRAINLKILIKNETDLQTQDALVIWGQIVDASTIFISLVLDSFQCPLYIYFSIALGFYLFYLYCFNLFLYYNTSHEPLDAIEELGYENNSLKLT